jgi:4-oxalocrotonate tautomerase family enzyme
MPLINIDMMTGRTKKQKEIIIRGITKAFEEAGIPKDWVHIVINENPPENWGIRGEQGSKVVKK